MYETLQSLLEISLVMQPLTNLVELVANTFDESRSLQHAHCQGIIIKASKEHRSWIIDNQVRACGEVICIPQAYDI